MCVCVCPAMRFAMLRGMGLKLGMGIGDGPRSSRAIFEVTPLKVKDHPEVKLP